MAIPILWGIWNKIEEKDKRIELTARATGPSMDTLRETPSHAHHSDDTIIVPVAMNIERIIDVFFLTLLTSKTQRGDCAKLSESFLAVESTPCCLRSKERCVSDRYKGTNGEMF